MEKIRELRGRSYRCLESLLLLLSSGYCCCYQTDYRRNMVKVRGANLRRMKDKDGNDYQIEKKIHYRCGYHR